ncbi:islet cell autoantigen 1 isoform X4 [Nerophis ophidion]|uniref:islet cell autoantigen 1 isoform X4 n=1 Tax=Nerophis ophidion TaxID=159077 RepID=UPI002AE07DB1|nr:islet cell autoantigen 1 isoform X4 [Nerophis ophidion]
MQCFKFVSADNCSLSARLKETFGYAFRTCSVFLGTSGLTTGSSQKMEGGNFGCSRDPLDRLILDRDSSVVSKFQQRYWKTKQTLIRVTGKKEDECVVASDADLDAKLEVFHSIQRTCMELLKVIEQYQRRICFLSQEESELGRFLRSQGSQDRSRAGKIMQATGKALCFSSQQRLVLRKPLCRLYQEVETFRFRAISDSWLTVNRMEQTRTEYRGALLWMKDVSQELDPDTHKQMEKFRKTTLLHFWEKTFHTMAAIHESFKGCPRSELPALKEAAERQSKKKRKKNKCETKDKDEELVSLGNDNSSTKEGDADSAMEEKDSLALLEEILGGISVHDGDFSQEWSQAFGEEEEEVTDPASSTPTDASSMFLPSQLLDQHNLQSAGFSDWNVPQSVPAVTEDSHGASQKRAFQEKGGTTKDLSAWFNLFADLDPLANPDAVGKSEAEHTLHNA